NENIRIAMPLVAGPGSAQFVEVGAEYRRECGQCPTTGSALFPAIAGHREGTGTKAVLLRALVVAAQHQRVILSQLPIHAGEGGVIIGALVRWNGGDGRR